MLTGSLFGTSNLTVRTNSLLLNLQVCKYLKSAWENSTSIFVQSINFPLARRIPTFSAINWKRGIFVELVIRLWTWLGTVKIRTDKLLDILFRGRIFGNVGKCDGGFHSMIIS